MSSRGDRRSALLLLALGVLGLGVRFVLDDRGAPGAVAYHAAAPARALPHDSVSRDSMVARALRLARPLRAGERIDVDKAPVEELARLPRVGPGLAARIAAERDAHGSFGSPAELSRRVPGAGPTLLAAIKPYADFTGTPSVPSVVRGPTLVMGERLLLGTEPDTAATTPRRGRRPSSHGAGTGQPPVAATPVSLNQATAEELAGLPGIGPRLARTIVADRSARGPYPTLDDLTRVRGVGPQLIKRLHGRLIVP